MSAPTSAAPQLTMRDFWRDLPPAGKWLLSTTAVQLLGRGLTLPFTVIYLHEVRHISLDVAGGLMAWIFAVGVIVTGPGGAAIDRFGARAVSLVGTLANMAGVGLLAVADTVPKVIVATTLIGAAGVTWPAFNALISAIVRGPARATYFGINFALVNLGIGLGGLVSGAFVDVERPGTFVTIYLVDASSMLIPIALLLGPLRTVHGRAEKPADAADQPGSYLSILRQPSVMWLMAVTFLGTFVGYGQMEAGFPAFAREVSQVSTRAIGWAFAANTAIIVFGQFFVLRRMTGHRRTRVLVVMFLVWAASWIVLGSTGLYAASAFATFGVIFFHVLFGFGETLLQPTIPAITNDLAPDHLRGRYNALSAGFFQAGGVLGPVVAGVMLRHDQSLAFIAVLLGCIGLAIVLTIGLERRITPSANGIDEGPSPGVDDGALELSGIQPGEGATARE